MSDDHQMWWLLRLVARFMNTGQNVCHLMTVDFDWRFENIFRKLRPK